MEARIVMPAQLVYRKRPKTNLIVLHDSHTAPSMVSGHDFLTVNGRVTGLLTCGYHFIIDRDGQAVECRKHDVMGSHCPGRNHDAVGICLMGGLDDAGHPVDNVTADQWVSLRTLVAGIRGLYGAHIPVLGHSEVQKLHERTCPCVPADQIRSLNDRHTK